jgi:hypothetical protein
MKILILENDKYICQSKDKPEVGRFYLLEDAQHGTSAQNRAFHALLNAFWIWMFKVNTFIFEDCGIIYDLSTPSQEDFKEFFKYRYGAGASHYQYVDDNFRMHKIKRFEEIPAYVADDFKAGNHDRIKAVVKSWTAYTKKERQKTIDMLLMIISISGCTDKKVEEIIKGMEEKSLDRIE